MVIVWSKSQLLKHLSPDGKNIVLEVRLPANESKSETRIPGTIHLSQLTSLAIHFEVR